MSRLLKGAIAAFLLIGLAANSSNARPQSAAITITLDQIFHKGEFDARHFDMARWVEKGVAYTTVEPSRDFPKRSGQDAPDEIVRYETESGRCTVLVHASDLVPPSATKPLEIENYAWSNNNQRVLIYTNSKKVWRHNTRGDYWVLDLPTHKLSKLGGNAPQSSLMFAKFAPNGESVAFVRENNLYLEDLDTHKITPLTTDGSPSLINGTSDWVNEEELDIRDGFRWSPDGTQIAFWQFDTSGVSQFTLINDTADTYPVLKQFPYPIVGTTNSAVRVGVVSVKDGSTRWMNVPGDPRNQYLARIAWTRDASELFIERLNRLQNENDVFVADPHTGAVRRVFADADPAWVDVVDSLEWLGSGKSFLWLSERDGWRHVYAVSGATGEPRLVTSKPFDVMEELSVDEPANSLYYVAASENAIGRYLYRSSLDGKGAPERLTPQDQPGTHSYDISPDGRWAFHTYSTFDHPPVIDLVRLPSHQVVRTLEGNEELVAKSQKLIAAPTEFFQVKVTDGATLDGWMIKPPGFDPRKKYPVLVFVYGEPWDLTVTDEWGGRRDLFHRAIANEGYLVVSFDNEGTPAPKGRAWRKSIFGSIGVLSSQDQADAIRALAQERSYIDTSRMAIWGWSGGGSNTLNLMFRYPGLFAAGMAVAPIADQRYYDTIYQERYMGLAKDNPSGYHDGSPINFAEGLTGKLLIVHGSGDDNCHFKVTELLLNRLIELGKPFDFMDYPNRTHSISEGDGTSFHIYSLLARYLEEHVPASGRPE